MMRNVKTIQYTPSDQVKTVLQILRLRGESDQMCIDRLLSNLLRISYSQQHYEEHFGPQRRAEVKQVRAVGGEIADSR